MTTRSIAVSVAVVILGKHTIKSVHTRYMNYKAFQELSKNALDIDFPLL